MRRLFSHLLTFVALSTAIVACASEGEDGDADESRSNIDKEASCSPFKLAEAGAKRALDRDHRTCESADVWGGAHYSVLDHLKDAKKTCGASSTIETIKTSKTIQRFLESDLALYILTGEVTGPDLTGVEKVFAAHELIFSPHDTVEDFRTTFVFKPNGTGTMTHVTDRGKVDKSIALTYKIERVGGVALTLKLADGTTKRYGAMLWPGQKDATGFDGIVNEPGVSDLCEGKVKCPKSGDGPCTKI